MKYFRLPTNQNFARTIVLLICLCFSGSLLADTVILKNGQVLNGKITAQTKTLIRITVNGTEKSIKKDTIKRIQYGKSPEQIQQEKDAQERQRLAKEKKAEEERQRFAAEEEKKQKEEAEQLAAEEEAKL